MFSIKKKFINVSVSMYIMRVCLFSALSRKVGALHVSIIINIIIIIIITVVLYSANVYIFF